MMLILDYFERVTMVTDGLCSDGYREVAIDRGAYARILSAIIQRGYDAPSGIECPYNRRDYIRAWNYGAQCKEDELAEYYWELSQDALADQAITLDFPL